MRGIELKQLRKKLSLTQKEFSIALNVSRPLISQIEAGKKSISKELEKNIIEEFHLEGGSAKVEGKIDFLRVRFKTHAIDSIIEKILHMDMSWFSYEAHGFYRYTETYSFGQIRLFRNPEESNMGVLLDLSGEGCRQLEQVFEEDGNRTWSEFFWSLYEDNIFGDGITVDIKVTRIDIALDELIVDGSKNFDLYELKEKVEQGLVVSNFKNIDYRGGFISGKNQLVNKGLTIYFGSRQSPLYFCFYQKDYDLAQKKNLSVEDARIHYQIKNRYEIRMADEKAFLFIETFLSTGESLDWLVKEVINGSMSVYEMKGKKRVFCRSWYEVIDRMEGLRLSVHAEKPSIEKTLRWLSNYLAPSLKMVKRIDTRMGTNELMGRIETADLKDKHIELIEAVCLNRKDLLIGNEDSQMIREYLAGQFELESDLKIGEEDTTYAF